MAVRGISCEDQRWNWLRVVHRRTLVVLLRNFLCTKWWCKG